MEKRRGLAFTLSLLLAASLWTLTLWKRVEALHISQQILKVERENSELLSEELCLRARLYRPMDLSQREKAAQALGMDRPRREQLLESESILPDAAAVLTNEETVTDALREFFRSP